MFAPPTNGYRILVYGRDSTLLGTRRMLLASTGFETQTVSSLQQLRSALRDAEPPYELIILCHTVPPDERIAIQNSGRRLE
jgi:DNA-binding response OmpR family regulator